MYNKEEVLELPPETYGFIYVINYIDNSFYVGKKKCISEITLPALKNGTQRPNSVRIGKNRKGKRVYFDRVTKEAKWKDYEGSSEFTTDLEISSKTILQFCKSKRNLTYSEVKWQFSMNALENPQCHNVCIANKWFRDNLI